MSFPPARDSLSFPFTIPLEGKLLEMRGNKGNGNGKGNWEGNEMKRIWLGIVLDSRKYQVQSNISPNVGSMQVRE